MKIEEWLSGLSGRPKLPPRNLRTPDTVGLLIEHGMGAIRGDVIKAGLIARSAVKLASTLRIPSLEGQAVRLLGHTFLLSDRPRDAIRRYERARELFGKDQVERANTSVALIQALGYVGKYSQAESTASEAIATFSEVGDRFREARVRANLGNLLHRQDRLLEATQQFEKAYPVLVEFGVEADAAIVAHNFAVCLMSQLEFDRAEALFNHALGFFLKTEQELLAYEVQLNQAYLLGRRGQLLESLTLYRSLLDRLPSAAGLKIAHCLLDQSDFMLNAGLFTDASHAARNARALFESANARLETGKCYLIESVAAFRRGHVQNSMELLVEAQSRLRFERSLTWLALTELTAAELNDRLGNLTQARSHIDLALKLEPSAERIPLVRRAAVELAIRDEDFDAAEGLLHIDQFPDLHALFHRKLGKPHFARKFAVDALREYDLTRDRLGSLGLRRAHAAAHEQALRECFRSLDTSAERLSVVARLKDQGLSELIRETGETRREATFLQTEHEPEAVRLYREQLTLTYRPLGEDGAGFEVEPCSQFVELFADEGRLFAFLISSRGVTEVDLGSIANFQTAMQFFHLHRGRRTPGGERLTEKALTQIMHLFEPVLGLEIEELIVGREGVVGAIPFHALPFNDGSLIESRRVRFAPSFSAWRAINGRSPRTGNGSAILGFADQNAPKIEEEVEVVARLMGRKPTRKFDRVSDVLTGVDHIHIAAHGIVREDLPLFSAMSLGESRFTVLEVLQMNLAARLVVLSGCSTGVSLTGEAFEAQGFIESLLASGCQSVVASLWEAADQPTLDWMTHFYTALQTQFPYDAYQTACVNTRDSWPHPSDWAAFAFAGLDKKVS